MHCLRLFADVQVGESGRAVVRVVDALDIHVQLADLALDVVHPSYVQVVRDDRLLQLQRQQREALVLGVELGARRLERLHAHKECHTFRTERRALSVVHTAYVEVVRDDRLLQLEREQRESLALGVELFARRLERLRALRSVRAQRSLISVQPSPMSNNRLQCCPSTGRDWQRLRSARLLDVVRTRPRRKLRVDQVDQRHDVLRGGPHMLLDELRARAAEAQRQRQVARGGDAVDQAPHDLHRRRW
jgi:hypothetical protein